MRAILTDEHLPLLVLYALQLCDPSAERRAVECVGLLESGYLLIVSHEWHRNIDVSLER